MARPPSIEQENRLAGASQAPCDPGTEYTGADDRHIYGMSTTPGHPFNCLSRLAVPHVRELPVARATEAQLREAAGASRLAVRYEKSLHVLEGLLIF